MGEPPLAHPPHIKAYMSQLESDEMDPEKRQAALDYKPSMYAVDEEVGPSFPSAPDTVVERIIRFSLCRTSRY